LVIPFHAGPTRLHLLGQALRAGQPGDHLRLHLLVVLSGDLAVGDQPLGVELARRLVFFDLLVKQRRGEAGLVGLVVPVAAVAPQVDDHVHLEPLTKIDRETGRVHDRFGVVAVHVEDRRLDRFRDVGRVGREADLLRRRGEADLVVDDHVDRAARAVARHFRQPERFLDDALPGEGGVAVQHDRDDAVAVVVVLVSLLAADDPLHDRVHELEVARVGREQQVDLLAMDGAAVVGVPEVVLHVAVALVGLVVLNRPFEFG
jgi:hypothetical protein